MDRSIEVIEKLKDILLIVTKLTDLYIISILINPNYLDVLSFYSRIRVFFVEQDNLMITL